MNTSITNLPTRLTVADCSKKKDCAVCLEKPRGVREFAFLAGNLSNPAVQIVLQTNLIVTLMELLMVMNFVPSWWNCISQAFRRWCQGAPFREEVFMTLVRCIIYGESRDNPDLRHGRVHGLMQIHECWDSQCRGNGYSNWRTDPCDNIGCGVYILCGCLRHRGWRVRRCGHWGDRPIQYDAIEHPRNHGFCDCMRGCRYTCQS